MNIFIAEIDHNMKLNQMVLFISLNMKNQLKQGFSRWKVPFDLISYWGEIQQ